MQSSPESISRPMDSSLSPEVVQKYLDENQQLILAILENQNLGKINDCSLYQTRLQQNLIFLASLADTQPVNDSAINTNSSIPNGQNIRNPTTSIPPQPTRLQTTQPTTNFKIVQEQRNQQTGQRLRIQNPQLQHLHTQLPQQNQHLQFKQGNQLPTNFFSNQL